ncbi:unnamed protein product [Closterium sp. NIES-53]
MVADSSDNNPKSNGGAEKKKERTAGQFFHIAEQGEQGDASAKVGAELHPLDYWVLDTGAAWTMTPRKELLDDVRAAPIYEVCSASGHTLKVAGAGRAAFKGADGKPVVLHDVLLVPDLKANLISLRKLAKAGVSTSTDWARTYKGQLGNRVLWDLHESKDVYRSMWQLPALAWHDGGQAGEGSASQGECNAVGGVGVKVSARSGETDWATAHRRLGHQKDHAASTIKEDWLPFVEKQAECVMKRIRTDRGGEFLGAEMTAWLKKQGIQRELTTAYTPQSNGVAERANRTILETARALLIESGVGAIPFAHVPKKYRSKLGASAIWCVHFGLAAESKRWLLWEPSKGVLFDTRDVKFVEGMMYGGWKKQPETKVSQQMEQITMQLDLTPSVWEEGEEAAAEGGDGEKVQEAPGDGEDDVETIDSTKEAAGSEGGEQQLGKAKSNGGAEKKERTAGQFFHIGEQGEQGDASAKVGAELHPLDYWVLDTGAAWTMTPRNELLDDVRAAPINEVCSASGHALKVAGAGRAAFKGADGKPVVLHDVLLVPDLKPSKKPLELVHMDLVGPLPVQGHKVERYFLTIVDDWSRLMWAYPLKQKDHAASTIKEDWLPFVEKQAECVVKRIRTDRGGEFLGAEMTAWLKKQGIQKELTTAYTPQSNGVAERANRTILETARALLIESGVGNSMWPHAVRHATSNGGAEKKKERTAGQFFHIGEQREKGDASAKVGAELHPLDYWVLDTGAAWTMTPRKELLDDLDLTPSVWEEGEEAAAEAGDGEKVQEAPGGGGDDVETRADVAEQQLGNEEALLILPHGYDPDEEDEPAYCFLAPAPEEPASMEEALAGPDREKWLVSRDAEYQSLLENETWDLVVLPEGKKAVQCKWVLRIKTDDKGQVTIYKSRLVAKGFMQKEKQDFNEIFAPTAKPPTLRVLLADAAVSGKSIIQMDILTAFLNGILEEDVYMTQPPGYEDDTGRVCKLKKSIYGLKQAPRCWYQKLAAVLEEMGFRTSSCDESLFLRGEGEKLVLFLVYLDDILLFSSSMKEIQNVQQQLMKNFKCKTLGEVEYYLGMHVERDLDHRWLKLHQEKFIKELGEKYGIENERKVATPLPAEFKLVKAAEDEGVKQKGVEVLKLKEELLGESMLFLTCFTDATWASEKDDSSSVGGYICVVEGGPVSWRSKKQTETALSSVESEYMAMFHGVKEVIWLRRLLEEIGQEQNVATPLFCDSKGALGVGVKA